MENDLNMAKGFNEINEPSSKEKKLEEIEIMDGRKDFYVDKKVGRKIPFIHGLANTCISNDDLNSKDKHTIILDSDSDESNINIDDNKDDNNLDNSTGQDNDLNDETIIYTPNSDSHYFNNKNGLDDDQKDDIDVRVTMDSTYSNMSDENKSNDIIIISDESSVEHIQNIPKHDDSLTHISLDANKPSIPEEKYCLESNNFTTKIYDKDGFTIDSFDRSSPEGLVSKSLSHTFNMNLSNCGVDCNDSELSIPGKPLSKHVKWFQGYIHILVCLDIYLKIISNRKQFLYYDIVI